MLLFSSFFVLVFLLGLEFVLVFLPELEFELFELLPELELLLLVEQLEQVYVLVSLDVSLFLQLESLYTVIVPFRVPLIVKSLAFTPVVTF